MHFAADRFVGVADASLHGHLNRLPNVNGAGAGRNIGVEPRIIGKPHMDISGPGADIPRSGLCTFGRDIAAAGLAMESALHSARGDISGAGMQINVTRSGFCNLDIPAPGSTFYGARDFARPQISGSRLQTNLTI